MTYHDPRGLCSPEEERELLRLAREGETEAERRAARDQLWVRNLGLARYLAVRYFEARRRKDDLDDLVAEAVLGLVEAIGHFDASEHPGVRFSTYATHYIKKNLCEHVAAAHLIHVPRYLGKVDRRRPFKAPSPDRLLLRSRIDACAAAARRPSADIDRDEGPDAPRHPAARDADPAEAAERADLLARLSEALEVLNPAHRELLALRFGLGGESPWTRRQVAARWGKSREWIGAVERKALAELRRLLTPCAIARVANLYGRIA